MPKVPSSPEQKKEARIRYRDLTPLDTTELDSVLRWVSERHVRHQASGKSPGEVEMLFTRLMLSGRLDSLLSSPKEGHAAVRMQEIELAKRG